MSEIPTPSLGLYLFNIIISLSLLMGYSRCYSGRGILLKQSQSYRRLAIFGILLYTLSIFGFTDLDFYGYYDIFKQYVLWHREIHMEPVYFRIADLTSNYYVWRAIIWGGSTILMLLTIRRLKLNVVTTLVFIGLIYALHFYKLRNALGFSIGFYGLSFLLKPNAKYSLPSYLFGTLLIASSFYFHRSMVITILLMVVCFIRFNRLFILSSWLAWPILASATTLIIKYLVSGAFEGGDEEMGFATSAQHYAAEKSSDMTLYGQIRFTLSRLALYIPLLYCSIKIYLHKLSVPKYIYGFMNFWYVSFYAASLFIFQDTSKWISERILTMGFFPMCVVLGHLYSTHHRNRMMKLCLILPLIMILFGLFYKVYKL